MTSPPVKVLVIGGSYAGLSVALNLLDLSLGKPPRFVRDTPVSPEAKNGFPLDIHIVDERDGYCEPEACQYLNQLILTAKTT